MNRKLTLQSFLIAALLLSSIPIYWLTSFASANPEFPPLPKDFTTIYIRNNGSVEPSAMPIQKVGNAFFLTGNLEKSMIVVEKDNIIIDGNGFTLNGYSDNLGPAIYVPNRNNVTIQNIAINQSFRGIWLERTTNCIVTKTRIFCSPAIAVRSSFDNQVFGNDILSLDGVRIDDYIGISGEFSPSENNTFFCNNFIDDAQNVKFVSFSAHNNWDNGTVGNYWSAYRGNDTNQDGIGDSPYAINANNQDNYPLMVPLNVSLAESTPLLSPTSTPLSSLLPSPSSAQTTTPTPTQSPTPNQSPTPSPSIPEFPSWIILPLFLAAILLTVISIKKKHMVPQKQVKRICIRHKHM
jgi:hypothetical protein